MMSLNDNMNKDSGNAVTADTFSYEEVRNAMMKERISLTMAPGGENHQGNQLIGDMPVKGEGFTTSDLKNIHTYFEEKGEFKSELLDLNRLGDVSATDAGEASVLVVRNYLSKKHSAHIYSELTKTQWDRKYLDPKKFEDLLDEDGKKVRDPETGRIMKDRTRRGRVMNKHARANLCLADGLSQSPNYREGKGTIVDWNTTPNLKAAKKKIVSDIKSNLDEKSRSKVKINVIEGNRYYNLEKCGIGFHGDTERNIVIALTIGGGGNYLLRWSWYKKSKPQGKPIDVRLNDGDLYIMSEKAVGTDWKKRSIYTLRHSAGCAKYTTIKKK